MKEIEITCDKERMSTKKKNMLTFLISGSCLAIIACITENFFLIAIGILVALVSLFSLLVDFRKASLPKLILTQEGIIDRSHSLNYDLILWSDIQGFRIEKGHEDYLCIDVIHQDQYIQQYCKNVLQYKFRAQYDLENDALGVGTPVFINTSNLKGNTTTILEKIQEYQNTMIKKEG